MYMSSKTKIVVIHMKELVISIVVLIALIAGLFYIIAAMSSGSFKSSAQKTNNSKTTGATIAPADNTGTTGASISQTDSISVTNKKTYTPGVYTASVLLGGNSVDVSITVDKDNINSIELIHISDAVTTMYPLLQTNFDEIADKVKSNGGTDNITYSSDNKYTSTMLLNAIQNALDKCTVK